MDLTYVATELGITESGNTYGTAARILVGGDWKFAMHKRDSYGDQMVMITMFTRRAPNGRIAGASFHMLPNLMHSNLTELANLYPN